MDRLPLKRRVKVLIPIQRSGLEEIDSEGFLPSSQVRSFGGSRGGPGSSSSSSVVGSGISSNKKGRFVEGRLNLFI
jgi:hypothetical protein